MPLLRSRRSSKSLPKFKAPTRKSCSAGNVRRKKKLEKRVPKVTLRLTDGVTSTLSKSGNWITGFETKDGGQHLSHLLQQQENLKKEKETLTNRYDFLLNLAKSKTEVLMKLEKERKQLLRIVRKNALNCTKNEEK